MELEAGLRLHLKMQEGESQEKENSWWHPKGTVWERQEAPEELKGNITGTSPSEIKGRRGSWSMQYTLKKEPKHLRAFSYIFCRTNEPMVLREVCVS